ncbi:wybutosine-synthesizing 5-like isoform X1 [Octopus vulgaris]|uniref:Wybutosine-synthesizing 5-like isoform X1 n=1 Tax=Octopus vulgaris TaxID=6645 RepID=A0AA36B7F4_OCTVU|nr:wybutosine-synthesizing 5-like isoform X1 [Octopus vulgaris]
MSFLFYLSLLLYTSVIFAQVEQQPSADTETEVEKDLTKEPGHLKKFGSGRPTYLIDEIDGFPDVETFFSKYVFGSRPLKMKGAAHWSPAYHLWTDKYFLSLDIDPNSTVLVEEHKKENRTLPVKWMHFQKFVQIYNDSNIYMVQDVPPYLKQDVILPCCIQCPELFEEGFATTVMWFSSGGTKSVIHTDNLDNINCLFRGDKEIVFVDPKYQDKIQLKTYGSYSNIDVDRMDYTQYPELAEIEYHLGNMTAGDCLYIPYLWIHQVRSYGSNLAVNIWWNNSKNHLIDVNKCLKECRHDLSLADVSFSFKEDDDDLSNFQDRMFYIAESKDIELDDLKLILFGEKFGEELEQMNAGYGYVAQVKKLFQKFDLDGDLKITEEELNSLPDVTWEECMDLVIDLGHLLEAIKKASKTSHEEL